MSYLAIVVDDDAPSRMLLSRMLAGVGFIVHEAADGEEAVALLQKHSPDLVLLDVLLPRMNGAEVLHYIRTTPHLSKTACLIVSAHPDFKHQITLSSHDHFIVKPINAATLREIALNVVTSQRSS